MHTNVKEPTVSIRGAISKQKHIKPGLYRLSDENAMNTDSQEYSPEFLDDLLHLFVAMAFWSQMTPKITKRTKEELLKDMGVNTQSTKSRKKLRVH